MVVAGTRTNQQGHCRHLEMLLQQDAPQVAVMPLDWETWQKQYPTFTQSAVFVQKSYNRQLKLLQQLADALERATHGWQQRPDLSGCPCYNPHLAKQAAVIFGFSPPGAHRYIPIYIDHFGLDLADGG